jgi:hypothetical protein
MHYLRLNVSKGVPQTVLCVVICWVGKGVRLPRVQLALGHDLLSVCTSFCGRVLVQGLWSMCWS